MDLSLCLIIYLVVLILVVLWMYKTKRTIWASLLYGLIFGMLILLLIYSPSEIDPYSAGVESNSALYLLIFFLTPIYVAVYSLNAAYFDHRGRCSSD